MNKTKVDDMLIEMIRPKIEEIESKFSNNQPLTQDDINTLLLKSQYNHINHLDQKLNETVESVKNLEHKFDLTVKELRGDYERLENKFDLTVKELRGDYESLENKFDVKFQLLEERVEHTIQKALNRNMMTLIIVIGAFLTLSKIIDKF